MGKNSGQIDIFNNIIFEKLIPKDHLLIKIDSIIDFSFVYDLVKDRYSDIGRESKDPVMMLKICLLEYLYTLSDPEVVARVRTDVAFRWFLGLNIEDDVPDDTTISHFRINRLGDEYFDNFFNDYSFAEKP
ncbi:transposase [Petroclostridium sp. X23]|uniref:transposase n=1 Tax=Petroclostridium sp. X23 TaxID=3045146 RepID=UPI0024AC9B09|nr:transposase [Petroclostridium sp. X23]WHH60630.1 transposase [Petroclostridium sp. X23]